MWTQFVDQRYWMKEGRGYHPKFIYIEAAEQEAQAIFRKRFGYNPHYISLRCSCQEEGRRMQKEGCLFDLSAFERGCTLNYETGAYVKGEHYQKTKDHMASDDVCMIRMGEIAPEERTPA